MRGHLAEFGSQSFNAIQRDGAIGLAQVAAEAGVGLGVGLARRKWCIFPAWPVMHPPPPYARTKAEAEAGIHPSLSPAIILRPSLVFGPGDGFFHRFAQMSRLSPFLPVVGDGSAKFQPVYVEDIAKALMAAIAPQKGQDQIDKGQIYELGGPRIYTFRELMDYLAQILPRRRWVMALPMGMAKLMATATDWLPGAP